MATRNAATDKEDVKQSGGKPGSTLANEVQKDKRGKGGRKNLPCHFLNLFIV